MKIKTLGHYRRLAFEIPEGEYESNDERLHGLAQWLVDEGYAEIIDAAPPELHNEAPVSELSELRQHYKDLTGKNASPKWDMETLREKIEALSEEIVEGVEDDSDSEMEAL